MSSLKNYSNHKNYFKNIAKKYPVIKKIPHIKFGKIFIHNLMMMMYYF